MKPSTLKKWHWVHKWTSLVCTVFALLLCVTGLPLIFTHEINHALGNTVSPPALEGPERDRSIASIDEMVADALTRRPGEAAQFVFRDEDEHDLWYVRLGKTVNAPEPSALYTYDGRTNKLLAEYPLEDGVMSVLLHLHVDMFAGLKGTLFLGFMGLVLVASIVSGVVLYAPYMKKLAFGALRRERSARILWLDVHNMIGIVTLGWFTVVSVTGVVNTLATPIFGAWQATHLKEMVAPFRTADGSSYAGPSFPQRALESALAHVPESDLSFMAFPGNDFAGPHQFVAFLRGNTPLRAKLLTPVVLDAESGRVLASRELPLYVSALLVSQPLHFGDYGGMPLKVLWALLDVLSIVLLGSGLYLWLVKRGAAYEAPK